MNRIEEQPAVSAGEALRRILNAVKTLGTEKISLPQAMGRILGEDIHAPRSIPPLDNSAMDGFALKAADTKGAGPDSPASLKIIETIPAGYRPGKTVLPGTAARIMTGALIPEGADSVIRLEDTEFDDDNVRILVKALPGLDIRRQGEDVEKGELVLEKGTLLRPAEIGMLASLGRSSIAVFQRPLAAILSTGDELVDLDGLVSEEKIVSSNSYSVAAQAVECGALALQIGIARDTREDLKEKLAAALRADVIVSSAGISVGDYDLVAEIMEEVGFSIAFRKVAQRPGRPMTFAAGANALFFALPGNPVSAMVSFEQYVRPALMKMMGHQRIFRRTVKALLESNLLKKKGLTTFVRARLWKDEQGYHASATGDQGSGILKSMVLAQGIIVLPADLKAAEKGDRVTVQIIDETFERLPEGESIL